MIFLDLRITIRRTAHRKKEKRKYAIMQLDKRMANTGKCQLSAKRRRKKEKEKQRRRNKEQKEDRVGEESVYLHFQTLPRLTHIVNNT